jgi:hypothetical protein
MCTRITLAGVAELLGIGHQMLPKGHIALCPMYGSQLVPSQCALLVGPGHIALCLPGELQGSDVLSYGQCSGGLETEAGD